KPSVALKGAAPIVRIGNNRSGGNGGSQVAARVELGNTAYVIESENLAIRKQRQCGGRANCVDGYGSAVSESLIQRAIGVEPDQRRICRTPRSLDRYPRNNNLIVWLQQNHGGSLTNAAEGAIQSAVGQETSHSKNLVGHLEVIGGSHHHDLAIGL